MTHAALSVLASSGPFAICAAAFQLKAHMKNFPAIVARVATVALVSSVPALTANAAADAAGYRASDFEVMSRAHQITITVVNGKLDADLPAGRRDEASKIMQAVEKSNAGRVEFGQVMMIRLEDVTRQGTRSMIIQGFDFNKSPPGSFAPHIA